MSTLGVICDINGTEVMAKNQEDCEKVGGKATHELKTNKEELPAKE